MTRRWRTALGAVCAAGFLLRAGLAAVDAGRPLFPPHYYNDERDFAAGADALARSGDAFSASSVTPGKELFTTWLALLERAFGPGVLPGRLFNAAAAAAAAGLWGVAGAAAAGPAAGLLTAGFMALWPSAAFHTCLAVKEAPVSFFLALTLALLLTGLGRTGRRALPFLAAAAASGLVLALLRSYLLLLLAAAAGAAAAAHAVRSSPGRRWSAVPAALCLAAAAAAYRPLKSALLVTLHGEDRPQAVQFVPDVGEHGQPGAKTTRPSLSPAGLSAYRHDLLVGMRNWSERQYGRAPESALFLDAEFRSWLDVALFLPKATFYELFMPLPGLYPTEGKPGRVLACIEGVALLFTAALAAAGLRRARWEPPALLLAALLVLAAPPIAFLEFDLGSASRHRIHLAPLLVPFAALLVPERLREP